MESKWIETVMEDLRLGESQKELELWLRVDEEFLKRVLEAQKITDKQACVRFKSFCTAKPRVVRVKQEPVKWELCS